MRVGISIDLNILHQSLSKIFDFQCVLNHQTNSDFIYIQNILVGFKWHINTLCVPPIQLHIKTDSQTILLALRQYRTH